MSVDLIAKEYSHHKVILKKHEFIIKKKKNIN